MKGYMEKTAAHKSAKAYIQEAAQTGANMICLPEMWNCPYSSKYFHAYAEGEDGESVRLMSELARENGVWLIGGSIPEISGDSVYNTAFVFSPQGRIMGKHRKIHLYDVDIEGGIRFVESETLSAGSKKTVVDTEFGKIGVAVCYDVRFPPLFAAMAAEGAQLILLPAAFNMTTGPAHWDLLMRARALDQQVYFAACSPARDLAAPYQAFGHSCIINPWGEYCGQADSHESILYGDIDLDYLNSVRAQLPLGRQRHPEAY
jgi:predicted amidohydrolase